MNDHAFDRFARPLADLTRRRVLRALVGTVLAGALGARGATAGAGCFRKGTRCRYDSQCCTLNCRFGTCR